MARRSCLSPIPPTLNGHVWETKEDGTINMWSLNNEPHNGPRCVNCQKGFCHHCHDLTDPNGVPPCKLSN